MNKKFNYIYKNLLSTSDRTFYKILLLLILIGTVLETLSVGIIFPVLNTIISKDSNNIITKIFDFLNLNSYEDIIVLSIIILFIAFTSKSIFLTVVKFYENKFIAKLKVKFSERFYKTYLKKSFIFHQRTNSYIVKRNLLNINEVADIVRSFTTLQAELLLFITLITLLFFFEPFGALIAMFIFGSIGFFFQKQISKRANIWGEERNLYDGLKLKEMQQGLGSIKEIKLSAAEDEAVNKFIKPLKLSVNSEFKQSFIMSLPRIWLEWFVIFFIIIFLFFLYIISSQRFDFINYIPILGLFGAAALRIIPGLSRIMQCLQGIKFWLPVVNAISKDVIEMEKINDSTENKNKNNIHNNSILNKINNIEIKDLHFSYASENDNLLSSININIKHGSIVGIVGSSGVGKTTLLSLIMGLIKPTKGFIKVDNFNIFDDIKKWQDLIGYVPQNIYLNDESIKNNIAFNINEKLIDNKKIEKAIDDSQLRNFISSLPKKSLTTVGECGDQLSGGQRQRIGIARALYRNPKILIMDESTNSLDYKTENRLLDEVKTKKGNKTIIIIAHRLSSLRICDKVYELTPKSLSEININKLI